MPKNSSFTSTPSSITLPLKHRSKKFGQAAVALPLDYRLSTIDYRLSTIDYCLLAMPAINYINSDKAKHEIYSMVLRKNKLRTNLFHKKQIFFEKITISLYIMRIQA